MNNIYKGSLSLEEKLLLDSLGTTDKRTAIHELEGLMMSAPTDSEAHPVIVSLYNALSDGHINIGEELAELTAEEEIA